MKSFYIITLSSLIVAGALQAATVVNSPQEAKKQAKEKQADCIVMVYGGDWDRLGQNYKKKCWDMPSVQNGIDAATFTSTLTFDQTTDKAKRAEVDKRIKEMAINTSSLPTISFFDKTGFEYCVLFGDTLPKNANALLTRIKQVQALRQKRDELITKSQGLNGIEKAKALGSAGDIGGIKRAPSLVEELKKCDPKDESGYVKRFTFEIWPLHQYLDKPKDEALKAIDAELASKSLTASQKQKIYGLRSTILRRNKASNEELKDNFKKMHDLDPDSVDGKAAVKAMKLYVK
ncbi:MAG: hypothetical protein RR138_03140 [Akkermansia sp.]